MLWRKLAALGRPGRFGRTAVPQLADERRVSCIGREGVAREDRLVPVVVLMGPVVVVPW